jgi:hypothetical protein
MSGIRRVLFDEAVSGHLQDLEVPGRDRGDGAVRTPDWRA